jgi:electron transport complex protein RnfA
VISNDMNLFMILVSSLLVNNILLIRFLALCSFFGLSNKIETSLSMGMAVIFVMVNASAVTWLLHRFLLAPLHLEYLRTIAFILVIAALVQFEELYIRRNFQALYTALGIYLPLITTNCAVLGVAILNIDYRLGFVKSIVYTLGVSLGYTLAIVLFASVRDRVVLAPVPRAFQGYPIAFITASLMSLAFMGFAHLFGL